MKDKQVEKRLLELGEGELVEMFDQYENEPTIDKEEEVRILEHEIIKLQKRLRLVRKALSK
jgi:hypothetical protein